jgi:hypothetical protein
MEFAAVIVFFFVIMIVVMVISLPLLIISRIVRLLKNSYAKLFKTSAKKA